MKTIVMDGQGGGIGGSTIKGLREFVGNEMRIRGGSVTLINMLGEKEKNDPKLKTFLWSTTRLSWCC